MPVTAQSGSRQNHNYSNNLANNKQAQLANAYQQLARELASDKIKVVGGYTLGRVIGEGTFGSVHLASHRITGTRCAIKKIPKSATPQLTREIHHHRRLHHPHIVHLHEIIATESHIWLVSELCSGGELFDYLVERGRILEGEARRLFGELCTAVGWMHSQGVVHRDLKLENVLLDGELRIKLGDLGFAREYQKGRLMETFCGTTGYASPEMLAGKKYLGVETDIWSLGIILYTLLCGGLPFDDDDERVMQELIQRGEYEEPEWLTEEARSLIRAMLQHEPADRLTMEGILTHPWFKKTLYDSIAGAASTDDPRSVPPSPLPPGIETFPVEPVHKVPSSTTVSSFPFSPLGAHGSSQNSVSPLTIQGPAGSPEPDSELSEASFEFITSDSKPTSGTTTPTTADEGEGEPDVKRIHSGEFSQTERTLELLHPNGSQATIRRTGSESPGSVSGSTLRGRVAIKTPLEGQMEEDEEEPGNNNLTRSSSLTLAMNDDHALHLPVADHSRTPLRTKRRSLSSQLPLERRHSHHSTSSQWQVFPPDDYLALLATERPPLFSTPSEKQLIHQLSDLGCDTGQLIHSVMSDACDSSAAMWWILRIKQMERGETDDIVEARSASAARRRERAAAYAREERRKTRDAPRDTSPGAVANVVAFSDEAIAPPPSFSVLSPSVTVPAPVFDSPELLNGVTVASGGSLVLSPSKESRPPLHPDNALGERTPPTSPRILGSLAPLIELSPAKERKSRSPSMNMLQRATSVIVGGVKKTETKSVESKTSEAKDDRDRASPQDVSDGDRSKRGDSPTKLHKIPSNAKMMKSASNPSLLSAAPGAGTPLLRTPEVSPSRRGSAPLSPIGSAAMLKGDSVASGSTGSTVLASSSPKIAKGGKKDSLWTTFRYLFNEDKRRRRRDGSPLRIDVKATSTIVPARGISARVPHVNRTAQPSVSSRRPSMDGNRHYSHRSSSVNSRRSSFDRHIGSDFAVNANDGLGGLGLLGRQASGRSGGSHTPTSDRERDQPSRPGSAHSNRHPSSRRSSMRSPTIQSDASSRYRPGPPASPLHDYHRRAASGGASTRVRHIKVLHEAKAIRPPSVASSIRSNASSRASSLDRGRPGDLDSDYDTGREDSISVRSLHRHFSDDSRSSLGHGHGTGHLHSLAQQIHNRTRSPLARLHNYGRVSTAATGPLRDVFQKKAADDDWESEEEGGSDAFVGGLGQLRSSTVQSNWDGARAAAHPNASARYGATQQGRRVSSSAGRKSRAGGSGDEAESKGDSSSSRLRRGGLPPGRNQAPVIEEEEEEEE